MFLGGVLLAGAPMILQLPQEPILQLALMNFGLAATFTSTYAIHRELDLTEPVHLANATLTLMFCVHPWAMVVSGEVSRSFHGKYSIIAHYPNALMLGAIAICSFNLGYRIGRGGANGKTSDSITQRSAALLQQSVGWSRLTLLLGTLGLVYVALIQGALFGGSLRAASTAYIYMTPLLIVPSSLLILCARSYIGTAWRVWSALALAGLCVFLALTGGRLTLIVALGPLLLHKAMRRDRRVNRIAVLFAAVLAVFILAAFRDVSAGVAGEVLRREAASPSQLLAQSFTGADTEMVDGISLALSAVPEQIAHRPGLSLVSSLAAPIPRALWHSKPVPADVILNGYFFQKGTNDASVAYSIVGEAFLDSGRAGVLILLGLIGWLSARVAVHRHASPASPRYWLFLLWLPFTIVLLRGILAYSLARFGIITLPLLLPVVMRFLSGRRPLPLPSGSRHR